MEDFIYKIIELDQSIDALEEEFIHKKKYEENQLRKRKEELDLKENELFHSSIKEYRTKVVEEIEREKNNSEQSTKDYENRIKKMYLVNKDNLIDEIFKDILSKDSD